MTDVCKNALGLLADVLEPKFPDAAIFLKSPEGSSHHSWCMQADTECGYGLYDVAYRAAVNALWSDQATSGEAGDFLNSRTVRDAYYVRVREEVSKLEHEAERANRQAAERRTSLKEKLDRLTRDGVLTKDEREELERDVEVLF